MQLLIQVINKQELFIIKERIMKKQILAGLAKVAGESKPLNLAMSDDLSKLAQHLTASLDDDELNSIVDEVEKTSSLEKEAKLINEGDVIICVDNYQPLFKGRRYLVSDASIPGFLVIKEQDNSDVGVFAINRFVLDNNEQ
jgi:hypothetical protein